MKKDRHHSNTVQQNPNVGGKGSRIQDDQRGGPTRLINERSNTMSHGKGRKDRPDGKRLN